MRLYQPPSSSIPRTSRLSPDLGRQRCNRSQLTELKGKVRAINPQASVFTKKVKPTNMTAVDYQGGKAFGQRHDSLSKHLDDINYKFLTSGDYEDVEDLEEKLESFKGKFLEFDDNQSGDIDEMKLKRMMEKLGQAKTHLELTKMIAEVDTTKTGTITYPDFLTMMLGATNSILKLILMFEEKSREVPSPRGLPPKRDLSSLP